MTSNSLEHKLKLHASDSAALNVESAPVMAALEVGFLGFSNLASLNSRLLSLGITYLGSGSLFTQGRDYSRKRLGITDETSEKVRGIHDTAYTAVFNFGFNLVVYPISQIIAGDNIEGLELLRDAGISAIIGAGNGWPMNYTVDVFRDLAGLQACNRPSYPAVLKNQTPRAKKFILAGLTAASIGLTTLVYNTNTRLNSQEKPENSPTEQIRMAKYDKSNISYAKLNDSIDYYVGNESIFGRFNQKIYK